MQSWIAGHDGTTELPFVRVPHKFCLKRILQNVITSAGEGVVPAFIFFEYVIMRLVLELLRGELGFKVRSEEGHAVQLIGVETQSHPDEMQMIVHQAIRRAEQALAHSGVQQQFAKHGVKSFVQPTAMSVRDGQRPVNDSVTLIILTWQARKIKRAVEIRLIHGEVASYGQNTDEASPIVAADVRRLCLKFREPD